MEEFTSNEKKILSLLSEYRNYDNVETELHDNAVGLYMDEDIEKHTDLDSYVARGVVSSLIQKDMLSTDRVNGKMFYRATDKCIRYLYECDEAVTDSNDKENNKKMTNNNISKGIMMANAVKLYNSVEDVLALFDVKEWSEEKSRQFEEMLTEVQTVAEKEMNELLG